MTSAIEIEEADSLEEVLQRGWLRTTRGVVPAPTLLELRTFLARRYGWQELQWNLRSAQAMPCETCEVCNCCICEVCGGFDPYPERT